MRVVPALLNWETRSRVLRGCPIGADCGDYRFYRVKLAAYLKGIGRSLSAGKLFPEGDLEARLGWYNGLRTSLGDWSAALREESRWRVS